MDVGGQRHVPAALPSWKETRYALHRRLGGPQGRSGCVQETSPHRDRTAQSVASRYPVPHEPYFIFKSRFSRVPHFAHTRTNFCETRFSLTSSMWGDGPGTEDLASWQSVASSLSQRQTVDQAPYCLQPTLTGLWTLHELRERKLH